MTAARNGKNTSTTTALAALPSIVKQPPEVKYFDIQPIPLGNSTFTAVLSDVDGTAISRYAPPEHFLDANWLQCMRALPLDELLLVTHRILITTAEAACFRNKNQKDPERTIYFAHKNLLLTRIRENMCAELKLTDKEIIVCCPDDIGENASQVEPCGSAYNALQKPLDKKLLDIENQLFTFQTIKLICNDYYYSRLRAHYDHQPIVPNEAIKNSNTKNYLIYLCAALLVRKYPDRLCGVLHFFDDLEPVCKDASNLDFTSMPSAVKSVFVWNSHMTVLASLDKDGRIVYTGRYVMLPYSLQIRPDTDCGNLNVAQLSIFKPPRSDIKPTPQPAVTATLSP